MIRSFVESEKVRCFWTNIEELIRNRLNLNRLDKMIIMMGLKKDMALEMEVKNAMQRIIYCENIFIRLRGNMVNSVLVICSYFSLFTPKWS